MSIRVDTSSVIANSIVCGNRGLGVTGSNIPSEGIHGAGFAYNDIALPVDADVEFRAFIQSYPTAGALSAYEDTSLDFTAPNGTYFFTYELFADGVSRGTSTVNLQIGNNIYATASANAQANAAATATVIDPNAVHGNAHAIAQSTATATATVVINATASVIVQATATAASTLNTYATASANAQANAAATATVAINATASATASAIALAIATAVPKLSCYCTAPGLVVRFGERELVQLTNRDMPAATVINTTVLAGAIADADAEINGYLMAYLPLAVTPANLERIACDITRYYLYDDLATEQVKERYKQAIAYLTKVAEGKIPLATDETGTHQPVADEGVGVVAGAAVFTDLSDY